MSWNRSIEYPGQITSIFRLFFWWLYGIFKISATLNTKAWKLKLPTDIEYSDPFDFKEPVSAFLWFIWKRQNLPLKVRLAWGHSGMERSPFLVILFIWFSRPETHYLFSSLIHPGHASCTVDTTIPLKQQ